MTCVSLDVVVEKVVCSVKGDEVVVESDDFNAGVDDDDDDVV